MAEGTRGAELRPLPPVLRVLRLVLWALLFASAIVTFTGLPGVEEAVRHRQQPPVALMVAPALLGLFIVLFAAYRFALVRAGHYHAGKAFVQVGLMVLVLTLLLPGSLERYHAAATASPVDLARPLGSPDPDARAMAAELVRHRDRATAARYVPRLIELLADASPEVRRQAHGSLVALAGKDVAGEDEAARAKWKKFFEVTPVKP